MPDLMNSRFKGFGGFGSKRTSSRPGPPTTQQQPSTTTLNPSAPTNGVAHTPTSSTTSLPMNQNQNGLGRPPSYTYNPNAPRATSPMPPQQQQLAHHAPPPINTGAYPQGHPALGGGAPQPPGYGGGYGQSQGMGAPQPTLGQYGGRGQAVEVEGAGRSKAQLIVGIDFVSGVIEYLSIALLTSVGHYILWCRIRFCDQYRSKRRHNNRMARCWESNKTKGRCWLHIVIHVGADYI